ncbi:hypothetical protein P3T29_005230 [Kitasatospora sp. MAP5-34]|nr:hypothetical protein [Kitasatospora sp. MAP5-34]
MTAWSERTTSERVKALRGSDMTQEQLAEASGFIALEAVASEVYTFQSQTIPALLQIPDYTRALSVASHGWTKPEEIEQFVRSALPGSSGSPRTTRSPCG